MFQLNDYTCEHCKFFHSTIRQDVKYDLREAQFLIIKIGLCGHDLNYKKQTGLIREIVLDTNINLPNDNDIIIPGDMHNHSFSVKAAIIFIPSNYDNPTGGGHYTCWQKNASGWVNISDSHASFNQKLVANLKNVYLLFLEKN